ncbi:MAG: hypothetical protein IKO11_02385 [Lachnospiraceae bacterium]|nr:hypothetical protein [Lachnospiraceae bacterium]
MFCENCGSEIDESMLYCACCGIPLKEGSKKEAVRRSKKKMPLRFYIILLVALLILLVVVPAYFVFFSKGAAERREMERQLKLAEHYLDELTYDKAVAAYRAVLKIDPENAEALEGLRDCSVTWAESEPERAEEILEESLAWYEAQGLSREGRKLEKELTKFIEKRDSERAVQGGSQETEPDEGDAGEGDAGEEVTGEEPVQEDDEGWKIAYRKLLSDKVAEYDMWNGGNYKFEPQAVLFYLDGDGIPEFAFQGIADGAAYMMFSYAEGKVVELGYSEGTEYIPGEGIFSIEQFWGGAGDSTVCKWDGKELKRLWYGDWEIDFDSPIQGQDGLYEYKYRSDGNVVSEAQYNADYERSIDRNRTVRLEYDKSYDEIREILAE